MSDGIIKSDILKSSTKLKELNEYNLRRETGQLDKNKDKSRWHQRVLRWFKRN